MSSPSQPTPPTPPNQQQSYAQGVNSYLNYLPQFLSAEMGARSSQDPQRIAEQQGLQSMFGPTQYNQMLQALQQIDPTGYNLRNQTGQAIGNNLALGTSLSPSQTQQIEQQVRGAQAARGNTLGSAAGVAEAYALGDRGQQMYQQRLNNALQFQNSATPEGWMSAIPPVQADRSMSYVDPNAGFQGQQFALQNYQNQFAQYGAQNQSNPWSSALGGIGSLAGGVLGGIYGGPAGGYLGSTAGGYLGNTAGTLFSDARIKTNIRPIGKVNGINVVTHQYKGDPMGIRHIGVIAQDVAKTRPDAVATDPGTGLMKVNYGKLGLPNPQPLNQGGAVGKIIPSFHSRTGLPLPPYQPPKPMKFNIGGMAPSPGGIPSPMPAPVTGTDPRVMTTPRPAPSPVMPGPSMGTGMPYRPNPLGSPFGAPMAGQGGDNDTPGHGFWTDELQNRFGGNVQQARQFQDQFMDNRGQNPMGLNTFNTGGSVKKKKILMGRWAR